MTDTRKPQYMVLIATALSLSLKYGINVVDLRSEEEWEQKSMLVFYVELVTGPSFDAVSSGAFNN